MRDVIALLRPLARVLPSGVRSRWRRREKQRLARARRSAPKVTLGELRTALVGLGMRPGHDVYVVSGLQGLLGLRATAPEVVALLIDMVGPGGTLLMQARSWAGTSLDFARHPHPFDPERTPAVDGLLAEIFRRWPGTERSRHPVWSSTARGARAGEYLAGHERADPPFGPGSPLGRLTQMQGYMLLLGVGLEALMLHHVAVDFAGVDLPNYTEPHPFTVIGANGTTTTVPSRVHAGRIDGARSIASLVPFLQRDGLISRIDLAGISLTYIPAGPALACLVSAIRNGALRSAVLSRA